ncbi:MAG TPA: calcium-binding protein [Nitrososphaeraceae archaeon]|nr:calcium-binding protein [Nitrososphaeraceae archaeon]
MLYTYALVPLCLPLLIASIVVLILVISNTAIISGQLQAQTIGVNITSPERGKTIPVNSSLTVSGKSTDNPFDEICQVSVIVNSVRPYQLATANGSIGQASDYSKWFFILSPNYTSIKEGINEITARLSCLPSITTGNNLTKWYSVNVTGVTVDQNATAPATTTPTTTTSPSQTLIPNQEQGQLTQPPSQLQPPTTLTPTPQGLPIDNLPLQESMQGGNEPDIIEGTLFADNIDGENGNDRVQGSSGDDTITGGNGDDYLQGDEGNDNLRGVNGDDMLFGGSGDDALDGGNGADNFSCGSGTDTILDFSSFQDDVKSADCEIS